MRFILEIELNNEPFVENDDELRRLLNKIANQQIYYRDGRKLVVADDTSRIHDENGNYVGDWEIV